MADMTALNEHNLTYWYQLGEWLDVGYTHRKAGATACPSPPIKEAARS